MKKVLAGIGGQVAVSLIPFALAALAAYLIWRRLFGANSVTQVVKNTFDAAATIPGGLRSLVGSAIRGESEATYITAAEQRQREAVNLARKQGRL